MADMKLFEYHHKQVRTVEIDGQIWFVANDVCEALSIGNTTDVINRLDEDEFDKIEVTDSTGRKQKTYAVNEPGLFNLILRSNKPEAKAFKRWVTHEVLPEIRKTGRYVSKRAGLLPLAAHTSVEVQKEMSKSINSRNFHLGGKQAAIDYNIDNCVAHTGYVPARIKHFGRQVRKLPAKNCTSAKEVLRVTDRETACCMSLADNLVEQGHEPEKVFEVTKTAKNVFKGILALGATPAELEE